MHIALVTETYPPEVNGVAMTNQRLVRGLLAKGHRITLIKPRHQEAPPAEHASLQVHEVFGIPIPNYAGLKLGLPRPGELERLFEADKPDIVHVATEGPLGFSSLRSARKLRIPVSSTFHTNFQDYCADYGAAFAARWMMAYLRWFHNQCALTTVPDPSLIQRLEKDGVQRLQMLGRGADTVLFSPDKRDPELRRSWGAAAHSPVALYVGRVAAEKDIPLTLEAWAAARKHCPELKMVVVGDGPVRKKLERQWPEVHFAGMRYDEDLARHYASADIFIFASTSETFGNVVIEAMASGLAVITYDYAAGKQFIQSGSNGHLVSLADRQAFIQCTESVIQEQSKMPPIRAAARATAINYPWSATIDRFNHLLQKAAKTEQTTPQIDIVSNSEQSTL
ncbi:glycosyltransferase family 1 protein [Coraliomargarita algicola]|uniref:Glycosyltransferase family 1 protein n=1 Tax=Coraliomargarita algicola TaxID=3092156 RepID=A0ABZ0RIY3_9BACT|nr:glycosyltransferase family 1 protein [Coraliomargarita sp. J2-16]WPJ95487.1 glycosyltransferase family 1 protein [Coraliomargarita sp. J2-16]